MKLTRDSVILWVTMLGAILTSVSANFNYLPDLLVPYKQWIIFASIVTASISGKLATSPLKGEND